MTVPTATGPAPDPAPAFRGIASVAGATVAMAMGFGSLVLPSIMAGPLMAEFGWNLADVSLGYAVAAFGMATGGLFWGRVTDRADLRLLLVLGSLFTILPLWALAHVTALWQFHVAHAVLGALGFGCLYPVAVCGAGAWFETRRGLVMGIVTAGGAVGQGVIPYAAAAILDVMDWRATYIALAATVAAAQIVVVAGVRHPAPTPARSTVRRGHRLRDRRGSTSSRWQPSAAAPAWACP
jgi:MFS family permease